MATNNYANLATGTVLTAPDPATSGTSLVLQSTEGADMPSTDFFATAHPADEVPTLDNAEIVKVTAVSTDTLTITRAQKSTTAKSIAVGWRITASLFADDNALIDWVGTTGNNHTLRVAAGSNADGFEAYNGATHIFSALRNANPSNASLSVSTYGGFGISTGETAGPETGGDYNFEIDNSGNVKINDVPVDGEATRIRVSQTSHGLSVGDVIRSNGTTGQYTEAKADTATNAEVVGIVTEWIDANTFVMTTNGRIHVGSVVPNETAGTVLFLSEESAGTMTDTEPSTAGDISKPLGVVIEPLQEMIFFNMRGMEIEVAEPELDTWHEVGDTGEPSFQNSWVNYGNGYQDAGFFKDSEGIVHLRGLVKSGSSASAVVFTLPTGYRPTNRVLHSTYTNGGAARFDVQTNGNVTFQAGGSTSWSSMDGISFPAA